MKSSICAFLFIQLAILAAPPILAQQVATGAPPFGSFGGGPDVVNLGNLNVYWSIPVRHKAGRSTDFDYSLSYNTGFWQSVWTGSTHVWQPMSTGYWGWNGLTTVGQAYANYNMTYTSGSCGIGGSGSYQQWSFSGLVYYDEHAVAHVFAGSGGTYISSTGGTSCPTSGANPSGWLRVPNPDGMVAYTSVGAGSMQVQLYAKDGTYVQPPIYMNYSGATSSSTATDPNGNKVTMLNGVYTDTLGQTALSIVGTAPSNTVLSYLNASSGYSQYTITYTSKNIKTNFGCSGITEYSASGVSLVNAIQLPDGRSYQFTYESTPGYSGYTTGRIASVTLPTGGTISYSYTGANNGIECSDASISGLNRTTPDGQYQYTRGQSGSQWTTTVMAPSYQGVSDKTVITFLTNGANYYEISRQLYSGSSSLQETVLHCYESSDANCSSSIGDLGTTVSLPIARMKTTYQWPNYAGTASGTLDNFDSLGNNTHHEIHDFASSGVYGSILQQTTTTWVSSYSSSGQEVPTEVLVQDGATPTPNKISDTKYSYTSTTTATSGTPQHASGPPTLYNLASVQRWVSGSTYLTQSYSYFDTGNVQTATDVNGAQTTYTYGGCGNSFPTSVSSQTGGSIGSLTTSATWNCTGGVPITTADVNGNTTTYAYGSDPYWRPTSITNNATTAVTSLSYPSSSSNSSSSDMTFNNGSSTSASVTSYDGLGRVILQQTQQGPSSSNYDTIATAYDSRGRVASTTLPYSGTLGSYVPSNPGTSTSYDELNRIYIVADSGGGTVQHNVSVNGRDLLITIGPQVTTPGTENLKQKNLEYNGAGWLTSVCEMVTSTQPAGGACGQASPHTGYLTKYTYDGGGRLTQVQQNAQSGSIQTRTISYDGLGRKISELIPEWSAGTGSAGVGTYTYDSDSSGSCGGSYPGDLVKSVDNMGNATCFTYDLLHRTLSSAVTAANPASPYYSVTPKAYFVYDAATYNGSAPMQNAKGALAEAYTCSGSCSSKITDEFFSTSPVTSGPMAGGAQAQMWQSTPHAGGYFFTQDTYYPNGTVGAISASLIGTSTSSTTNLITDSTQVGSSGWGTYCGNSNGMVIDTTAVAAPDGTHSATQFTMPSSLSCGSSNAWGALTYVQGGLIAGTTYTVSVWLRGAVGGESVNFGLNDCALIGGVTLSTSWQRYTVTFASISSAVANCSRGFEVNGLSASSIYYVWGPQTVPAATAGPYVATTDGAASYIGIPSLTFGVDGEGRPATGSDGTNNLVTATSYNPASAATSITYGNASTGLANDVDSFGYDPNTYRPTNLTYSISPSSGTYTVSTALTWNANGSLQRMVYTDGSPSPMSQNCTYSADDLSRIASVDCGSSAWGQNFSYDPFGNIQKAVPPGRTGTTYATGGYSTVTNQASTGVTYDKNGNQLSSTPATLTWNAWNVPVTVNSTSATYDALGRMVEKGSGPTYTQFVFRPSGNSLAVYSSNLTKGSVPLPGGGTAIYNSSGLNYIRHTDWLGSARLSTTWAHVVYSKEAYAPFGETYNESGTPDRSFTGQDQNVATGSGGNGAYDFLFRKYDPSAGRWLSPDPAGWDAVDLSTPQSLDRYAYALNDPTSYLDPFGLTLTPIGNGCYIDVTSWSVSAGGQTVSGEDISPPFCIGQPNALSIPSQTVEAPNNPCANSALTAAGTTAQQQIATAQGFIAAGQIGATSTPYANPITQALGGLIGYFEAVKTGGPNDIKNLPGHSPQNPNDVAAGNISFGITCPYGATFCQVSAGFAQGAAGLLNQISGGRYGHGAPGPARTFFDSPSDNAQIKIGQAMRAAGCHE